MLQDHNITAPEDCQVSASRFKIDVRKILSRQMAALYNSTGLPYLITKGGLMMCCGDDMVVRSYDTADLQTEIVYTRFCGVRLCPICAHRRSLKAFWQLSRILDYVDTARRSERGAGYAYILITLTVENVQPDALQEAIDRYVEGCSRLIRTKAWSAAIKGCWRSLEITYNQQSDTFHPHIHLFCAVNPSYFTDKTYISHDRLTRLWQRSAKLPYTPIVDIRRVKGIDDGSAKAEVSKYVTKQSNFLLDLPVLKSQQLLISLEDALFSRKQWITYGIFRTAARALHLSDEDAQLLDPTDGDEELLQHLRPEAAYVYQLLEFSEASATYEELDPFFTSAVIENAPASKRMHYRIMRGRQLSQLLGEGSIGSGDLTPYEVDLVRIYGEHTDVRK